MGEKTHSVQFYVTEDVKQTLRIAAAENQESMAAFARTALQEALEDHEVQSDD
jgi:plasmid stability protein